MSCKEPIERFNHDAKQLLIRTERLVIEMCTMLTVYRRTPVSNKDALETQGIGQVPPRRLRQINQNAERFEVSIRGISNCS